MIVRPRNSWAIHLHQELSAKSNKFQDRNSRIKGEKVNANMYFVMSLKCVFFLKDDDKKFGESFFSFFLPLFARSDVNFVALPLAFLCAAGKEGGSPGSGGREGNGAHPRSLSFVAALCNLPPARSAGDLWGNSPKIRTHTRTHAHTNTLKKQ